MNNMDYVSELQPGTTLNNGRYTIEKKIGQGGFCITYMAIQNGLGRTMCIKEYFIDGKCVRNPRNNRDVHVEKVSVEIFEKYRLSFVEEAQMVAMLHHPNVVEVTDVFDENNTSYMVMSFIEGVSLQYKCEKEGPLSVAEAVDYITQIAKAVGYLHQNQILHRDIKPDNILVTSDAKAILIDFGSARKFQHDKTQAQTSIVTPGYAPIEQYHTKSRKGCYTDIYAIGATLYFLLTGERPMDAVERKVGADEMPEPRYLNPTIPDGINRTIVKAMQIYAKDRHQSTQEFLDDMYDIKPSNIDGNISGMQANAPFYGDVMFGCNVELQPGMTLNGKYTIKEKIGQGGFGITYKAVHNVLGKDVCIKEYFMSGKCVRNTQSMTVQQQGIGEEVFAKYKQAFIREAQTLAKLHHPGIVEVTDVFEENNTAYMVMPFIEGISLQSIVEHNGPLAYPEAVNYMAQITRAVEYIHQRHILHRDIKPENIMITADYKAILIDFGSAREFEQDKTQAHTSMITKGYAPIEQYNTTSRKGSYTDIYAIGATMYFILTGQQPLDSTARLMDKMPEPKELNPSIPEEVNRTIMKAMQVKACDRHQTVQEFMNDLRNTGISQVPLPAATQQAATTENITKSGKDNWSSDWYGTTDKRPVQKKRHGFVSFWLIFMLVGNILALISLVFVLSSGTLGSDKVSMYFFIVLNCILNAIGLITLLKWKKIGFWLFLAGSVFSMLIDLATGGSYILLFLLGFAIFWAVLQIKENGVSCWSQLE